ncbi:hypothetical protein CHH28_02775 [Bacterioplanes sanyensis]|uniref:Endonuclease n=2 Tax=Bacterioplanes sanyensis TaxID=1249553 RepID=A0A222FQX8_9GAMM|nr:hypothetical protein CHH28_02775 [Bacterioplanes sanyensis]
MAAKHNLRYKRMLGALLLAVFSSSGWAFSGYGHGLICNTAQQALPATLAQRLDDIARAGGQKDFAQLCTWPDTIRRQREFDHTKTWHYINVSRSATQVVAQDCGGKGCVTEALQQQWAKLQQLPNNWQALAFVGHFVGDIHQPMHVSYRDDRGGNRLRLNFAGERSNLHQYWDGRLLQRQPQRLKPVMLSPTPVPISKKLPVYQWATESLQITRMIYRQPHKSIDAGSDLHQQHIALWNQQASLAAQRLAELLNALYRGQHD